MMTVLLDQTLGGSRKSSSLLSSETFWASSKMVQRSIRTTSASSTETRMWYGSSPLYPGPQRRTRAKSLPAGTETSQTQLFTTDLIKRTEQETKRAACGLTCSQRYDADGRLATGQFVPHGFQDSQHPAHRPIAPADQHPKPGDLPEGVEAEPQREQFYSDNHR